MAVTEQSTLAVLADLLGRIDALWAPIRRWNASAQVRTELRQVYRGLGILAPSLGGDRAERARAMEMHERSGLILPAGSRGQSRYWKLTDSADWKLRAMCSLSDYGAMRMALSALSACERSRHDPRDNMVPETWLMGVGYDSSEAADRRYRLDEILAPAACRGLVTSTSDRDGRTAWQSTGLALPADPGERSGFDERLANGYTSSWCAMTDMLALAKPSACNVHVIPLSAGEWPSPKPPRSAREALKPLWEILA